MRNVHHLHRFHDRRDLWECVGVFLESTSKVVCVKEHLQSDHVK